MFKIGDFSRFSRVSVKMLRHYDEIGLLKPAHVDPVTSYRYYTADQLPQLNRIIALKDLGFSLEQIASLLDTDLSADEMRGLLKLKRAEIAQRVREEQARLAQVEARIQQIEQNGTLPAHEVLIRAIPAQLIAGMREVVVANSERITTLFDTAEAYVATHNARAVSSPMLIYHDSDYRDDELDVEIGIPLSREIPPTEQIHVRTMPAVATMACVVHTGDYASMTSAFTSLFNWIDAHDYAIAGATREVFLRFGANNAGYHLPDAYLAHHAAEFVTELQVPVAKQSTEQRTTN